MTTKKNILILHHFPHLGGAENYLVSVLKALNKHYNTFLICQEEGAFTQAARASGTSVTIIKLRGWRKLKYCIANYFTVKSLIKFCGENKIDVVASGYYRVNPYAVHAAKKLNIPSVCFIQDIAPEATLRRFEVFESSALIGVSRFIVQDLEKAFKGKVHVIHNEIDIESFNKLSAEPKSLREEFNIGKEVKIIGMIAHFVPWKGHAVFLDALKEITHKRDDVVGFIVGTELYKHKLSSGQLQETVKNLCLEDKIIFAGERQDIARIVHSVDIFVHPSFKEGFGRVVMEAMAAGCAVVATDCGGPKELIEDGLSGILVPVGNSQVIAEAVLALLADNNKRRNLGENARKRIAEHFTFGQFEQKIVKAFEGIPYAH